MVGSHAKHSHLLAHQGGWDEILLVAGPIVIVIALLALVKRRVERAAAQHERARGASPSGDADSNLT